MGIEEQCQKELQNLFCPSVAEIKQTEQVTVTDSEILFSGGAITELYCRLYAFYLYWACRLLVAKSGLYRLDKKLDEQGYSSDRSSNDFYQKYDQMGLKFFYLRSFAHIERLSDTELLEISDCMKNGNLKEAAAFAERTYRKVLAVDPEHPEEWISLYPSIHGNGNVKGGACAVGVRLSPEYNNEGMLKDTAWDERRIKTGIRIKKMLEERLPDFWEMEAAVILEE